MSMTIAYFQAQVIRIAKIWPNSPVLRNNLTAISSALGSDTTTHTQVIQTPPAALKLGGSQSSADQISNKMRALVNRGKGGNLPNAAMANAINQVIVELALP
jgi:hypothetical protein